jgi:hypothetical protein
MKHLALIAVLSTAAVPAMAQVNWNSSQLGSYTYHHGTDSQGGVWNGTSSQLGSYRYDTFHGPNGQTTNCTSSQLGSYRYTNCN